MELPGARDVESNSVVTKAEQVSKNRFHNELKLTSASEIDEDLLGWLKDAYALG